MNSPHRSVMQPTYVKPFLSNVRPTPQKTMCYQPLGVAKPVENEQKSFDNNQSRLTPEIIEEKTYEKSYNDNRYENHSEHLSSLHTKLYAEAERIRKWKISTEMDIKLKDKKLNDSLQVIESQRKSLLELQLQNENLSQRLSEEIDNRQEILQKVSATRELCFVAKNHMDCLEEKICQCEATRLIIEELNKKRVKEYEDLCEKFKEFYQIHEDNISTLNDMIHVEKTEKEKLITEYNSQLKNAAKELESVTDALKMKEVDNSYLQKEIENYNKIIANITEEKEKLQNLLQEQESLCNDKTKEISLLNEEIKNLKEQVININKQLETSKEEIQIGLQKLSLANEEMTQNKKQCENVQNLIEKQRLENEEIKEKYEIKIKSLNDNLNEKQEEIEQLKVAYLAIKKNFRSKVGNIKNLCKQINILKKEIIEKNESINEFENKFQESLNESLREKETLNEEIVRFKQQLKEKEENWEMEKGREKQLHNSHMKEILMILDKAEEDYRKSLTAKENELQDLKNQIEKLKIELRSEQNKEAEISRLQKEREKSENKVQELQKINDEYHQLIKNKESEIFELKEEIEKLFKKIESENNIHEEIIRLKSENDKLQIKLEDMEENNKTEIKKLIDDNHNLQTQLEKLQQNMKLENKENNRFGNQNSSYSYGGIFQTPKQSPNLTHCTVKRTPFIDLTVQNDQNIKCYSKAAQNKKARTFLKDTENLDYKPQQRKFFKTTRCIKKNQKKDGLLWFDLEESYLNSKN